MLHAVQHRAEKSCVLREKNLQGLSQESKLPKGRRKSGKIFSLAC